MTGSKLHLKKVPSALTTRKEWLPGGPKAQRFLVRLFSDPGKVGVRVSVRVKVRVRVRVRVEVGARVSGSYRSLAVGTGRSSTATGSRWA